MMMTVVKFYGVISLSTTGFDIRELNNRGYRVRFEGGKYVAKKVLTNPILIEFAQEENFLELMKKAGVLEDWGNDIIEIPATKEEVIV